MFIKHPKQKYRINLANIIAFYREDHETGGIEGNSYYIFFISKPIGRGPTQEDRYCWTFDSSYERDDILKMLEDRLNITNLEIHYVNFLSDQKSIEENKKFLRENFEFNKPKQFEY